MDHNKLWFTFLHCIITELYLVELTLSPCLRGSVYTESSKTDLFLCHVVTTQPMWTLVDTWHMSHLCHIAFNCLLRFLDVTSARVGAIENHVFDGLHEMESLWLDENRIGLLPKSIFCGLEHLKELNLNANRFVLTPFISPRHSDSLSRPKSLKLNIWTKMRRMASITVILTKF